METDEQTPKKQNKKILHIHKKQYFTYNIIKTKKMLPKKCYLHKDSLPTETHKEQAEFYSMCGLPRICLYSHSTAVL